MENTLPKRFKKSLQYLGLDLSQPYVLAVSGGLDSTVLCDLCYKAAIRYTILHVNFGLRGAESNRDEDFVKSLGVTYGVEVLVKHVDTESYADEHKLSVQEAARILRYTWFEEVRKQMGAPFIFLAHHANDNIETALMHFFRGTGLQGLTGMPQKGNALAQCLRPLLHFTRKELHDYAIASGIIWVEDSSNAVSKYTRNFFRNKLIPQLQHIFPQVEENVLQNIERFGKVNQLYLQLVQKEKEKLLHKKGVEHRIAIKRLISYKQTSFIYEMVKDFGFSEKSLPEILKLADSVSGSYMESESYRIIKHRAWFIITPKQQKGLETFVVDEANSKVYLPDGVLELEKKNIQKFHLKSAPSIAQLDAEQVQFPLIIRRWKEGDYFYPLGMPKKKKVARFFIDQKLAATEKENTWVLESANRIAWVINHRIDDRFKIKPHTRQVLQIKLVKD